MLFHCELIVLISVKKNLHENDIVHEVQALKNASKLCRCVDNSRKKLRGPFLALVAMDAFEKKEKTTEQWIFEHFPCFPSLFVLQCFGTF